MTRMTDLKEIRREIFENALLGLGTARILNDQALLRVRQAIQRDYSLGDLLVPALDHLDRTTEAILRAQAVLGDIWSERNKRGW